MQTIKKKKLIFTADDFGYDKYFNDAILRAYNAGMLNSAALLTNFDGFNEAIEFYSQMQGCQLGVHLNIIEGKSLTTNETFSDGFLGILNKSTDKKYLDFVEKEFRTQIEKILNFYPAQQLNSHVHVHAIPSIFNLTCKLAKEYNIKYVRTQFERPYFIPDIKKYLGFSYPVNMAKVAILNFFTLINKITLKNYNLSTNDYIIGVNYTANMDCNTVKYGLKAIQKKANVAEILAHPCYYTNENMRLNQHYKEFQIYVNDNLRKEIEQQGWIIKK